jgi:hypothetical protein
MDWIHPAATPATSQFYRKVPVVPVIWCSICSVDLHLIKASSTETQFSG